MQKRAKVRLEKWIDCGNKPFAKTFWWAVTSPNFHQGWWTQQAIELKKGRYMHPYKVGF